MFLFKSRLLVCKVRRISDDRSVFVLKDIVKLPDCQLVDQPQSPTFEVHTKSASPQTFSAHHEDVKIKWLREIGIHANDPLALHEHTVDDLRIDPSQVKADTDTEAFKLPPRIDAHEPESVKPSEVAKDHYLPHPEKAKTTESATAAVEIKQETKIEERSQTTRSAVSSVQSNTSITSSKVESKTSTSAQQVSVIDTKQVVAESNQNSQQQKTTAVQSQAESVKTTTVQAPKASPQPEKAEIKPAIVEAKASPKVAPVETKTEYIVTEPLSLNASSVSVNTIADLGTRAQIQGKCTNMISAMVNSFSYNNPSSNQLTLFQSLYLNNIRVIHFKIPHQTAIVFSKIIIQYFLLIVYKMKNV